MAISLRTMGWMVVCSLAGITNAGLAQESTKIETRALDETDAPATSKDVENKSEVVSQIASPTHRQFRTIKPQIEGKPLRLLSFCMANNGNVIAVCQQSEAINFLIPASYSSGAQQKAGDEGIVVSIDAAGEQSVFCKLPFIASAIACAPDGAFYAAGSGKIAHLSSDGSLVKITNAPNVQDEEEMLRQAEEGAKKMKEKYTKAYEEQISTIKERMNEIEAKEEDKRTRTDKARLQSYEQQLQMYQSVIDQMGFTADTILQQAKRITAIAANENDVFVSCGSLTNSGYTVWRTNRALEGATAVVESIGGCCGQMDLQCCEEGFAVAENTSFQVGIYDRDGKRMSGFGKGDRNSKDGFGSCCNPMNVYPVSKGEILTAESSIGHIKRFDSTGKFVSYVGQAKIGGGCKHCSLGYDPASDQYYMMHEDANSICVLGNRKNLPEQTDEEKAASALFDKHKDSFLGTWQLGGDAPAAKEKSGGLFAAISSLFGGDSDSNEGAVAYAMGQLPWKKATFQLDGNVEASMPGVTVQGEAPTWTWELIPEETTPEKLVVQIKMDQTEYLNLEFDFQDANRASVVVAQYGTRSSPVAAVRILDCNGKSCEAGKCETTTPVDVKQ